MTTEVERVLNQWLTAMRDGGDFAELTTSALFALAEIGAPSAITREVSRLAAIAAVDKKMKQPGWTQKDRALFKAARAMLVAYAPPEEIFPLVEMHRDVPRERGRSKGKKPRELGYRTTLATFSAAVTAMKKGRRVDDVIAEVATPTGINRKELKNFRNRLNRGLINDGSERVYRLMLIEFRQMPRAQIMSILSRTSERFCT